MEWSTKTTALSSTDSFPLGWVHSYAQQLAEDMAALGHEFHEELRLPYDATMFND
jgi:hypothetical protein